MCQNLQLASTKRKNSLDLKSHIASKIQFRPTYCIQADVFYRNILGNKVAKYSSKAKFNLLRVSHLFVYE